MPPKTIPACSICAGNKTPDKLEMKNVVKTERAFFYNQAASYKMLAVVTNRGQSNFTMVASNAPHTLHMLESIASAILEICRGSTMGKILPRLPLPSAVEGLGPPSNTMFLGPPRVFNPNSEAELSHMTDGHRNRL